MLHQFLSVGLSVYIAMMTAVSVLVFADVLPLGRPRRTTTIPDDEGADWSCTLVLTTSTVIAVDEQVSVEVTLDPGERPATGQDSLRVTFPEARSDGDEAVLTLQEAGEQWSASETLTFVRPGEATARCDFGFARNVTAELGRVAPQQAYYEYRNSQYVLLLTTVTSILAAGGLLVSL